MSNLGILTTERSIKKLVTTFTFCNLGILEDVKGELARTGEFGWLCYHSASSYLESS